MCSSMCVCKSLAENLRSGDLEKERERKKRERSRQNRDKRFDDSFDLCRGKLLAVGARESSDRWMKRTRENLIANRRARVKPNKCHWSAR